jgi:hypothetical protein
MVRPYHIRPNPKRLRSLKHPLIFLTISVLSGLAANAIARADVRADSSSIAIGGSVTQSTFIIGIPQEKVDELVRDAKRPLEELTAQQRDNIVLLKDKLDLNVRQVRAALAILGENDIPPERLAARLVEIAQRFNDLQATASALPGDSQKVIALKAEAQKAIGVGELAKADSLLAEIDTEIDTERVKLSIASLSKRLKIQPGAEISRWPDCGIATPRDTLPTRPRSFLGRVPMRICDSAIFSERRTLSIGRETNLATMPLSVLPLTDISV